MRAARRVLRCAVLLSCLMAGSSPAVAQQPGGADPRLPAAQAAFDALPETERKAIQTDLIWTGHFSGTATGGFGPLTFRAINAFAGKSGLAADGRLDGAQRERLAKAAQAARARVGFAVVKDPATGAAIGIPQNVLPRREPNQLGGSRWQSADQRITLDTRKASGETLDALFERATTVNPNVPRRVTYKLLRPDFYVVSGETPSGKFYQRMVAAPDGPTGFSIGYDKALAAEVDPLVVAIANAFDPAGSVPAVPQPQVPAAAASSASSAAPAMPADSSFVNAVMVAQDRALASAAALAACRTPSLAGRPVRALPAAADGTVTIELPSPGSAVAGVGGAPAPGEPVVVLTKTGMRPADLVAVPAEMADGARLVRAPLQPGAAGSAVFNRKGRLVGLVLDDPAARYAVAGVVPERLHRIAVVPGDAAGDADGAASLSLGAIVSRAEASVLAIACGR